MNGTFFSYRPGAITVNFRHGGFDYFELSLLLRGDVQIETPCDASMELGEQVEYVRADFRLETFVSSAHCPFPDLIAWLEAITCNVQECAFGWDAEGPEGRLGWQRGRPDGNGFLEVTWTPNDTKHRVRLSQHQLVAEFYSGFRAFVESPAYDPQRYEFPRAFGAPLQNLRSTIVEHWLTEQ